MDKGSNLHKQHDYKITQNKPNKTCNNFTWQYLLKVTEWYNSI